MSASVREYDMARYRIGVPVVWVHNFTLEADDRKHAREIAEQVWADRAFKGDTTESGGTMDVSQWEVEEV